MLLAAGTSVTDLTNRNCWLKMYCHGVCVAVGWCGKVWCLLFKKIDTIYCGILRLLLREILNFVWVYQR